MKTLEEILQPEQLIQTVDIGALPIDGNPPYKTLLQKKLCKVTGFEPSTTGMMALKSHESQWERYLPYALGDGERHTYYHCYAPGMNSLLEPDPKLLQKYPQFNEWGYVRATSPVDTKTLDSLAVPMDYLKMDCQGSELMILKHAKKTLERTLAIQLEVSFNPLYKKQPCFGELDTFLRQINFHPYSFVNIKTWRSCAEVEPEKLLEADVLYVRNYEDIPSAESWKMLALIAHYCYDLKDLTAFCVKRIRSVL